MPDEPFLAKTAGLEVGARLLLSRSIADGSATLLGWSSRFGVAVTVGSVGTLAGVDEAPERNCW